MFVDTDQLTEGDAGLECTEEEKVCEVTEETESQRACVEKNNPAYGCASPDSCGPCIVPGAIARCGSSGQCEVAICDPGYADCDKDESNGCETQIANDESNCGGCGIICEQPHAVTSCIESECRFVVCDDGFANCDDSGLTGCEADLNSSEHCGACYASCTSTCTEGSCSE